jgi:hypothetical protein
VLKFQLSYDYRCPFAKNLHLHVVTALRAGADFDVNFVPWTMSQGYKADGAPDVWDDPSRDEELLALAASSSIRDFQPEYFLDAHEALFRARHERAVRLVTVEEISDVLSSTGVDLVHVWADVESRRPHKVIGESFREFDRYEAFGVPTIVVGDDATFVRYMTTPNDHPEESIAVIELLVNLIVNQSALNEFKHTKVAM